MPRSAVRRKNAPPIPCISKNARIISVHLHIEKAAAAAYTKFIQCYLHRMSANGWRHRAEKRGGCFMRKRLLSGLLAVSMMFSLCPASAFADDTGGGINL